MLTHNIQPATRSGFVQITDISSGQHRLVFVGAEAAQRLEQSGGIRVQPEAPSQKWCSVIAA